MASPEDIDIIAKLGGVERDLRRMDREDASVKDSIERLESEIATKITAREKTETELKSSQLRSREIDAELQKLDQDIKRASKNREEAANASVMEAAERQINQAQEKRDELEAQGLELLESDEKADASIEKLNHDIEAHQKKLDQEESTKLSENEARSSNRDNLLTSHKELNAQLEPELANEHKGLVERYGYETLTRVDGEVCASCSTLIPPGIVRASATSGTLSRCPSCGRMIIGKSAS